MQFSLATIFTLVAVASAYSIAEHNEFIKRQDNVQNLDPSIPAMTDANGNVIPFDAANVYKDSTEKGL